MTLDKKKDLTPGNVTFECTWNQQSALCWYFSYSLKKYALEKKDLPLELEYDLEDVMESTYQSIFCEILLFLREVKPSFNEDAKNGFPNINVNFIYYF